MGCEWCGFSGEEEQCPECGKLRWHAGLDAKRRRYRRISILAAEYVLLLMAVFVLWPSMHKSWGIIAIPVCYFYIAVIASVELGITLSMRLGILKGTPSFVPLAVVMGIVNGGVVVYSLLVFFDF